VRFLRENSLSLFFGVLLVGSLIGQSFAGLHQFNADAVTHHESTYTWFRYVTSSEFGGDVMENWQSEFLQFSLYILSTVWLLQRGSSESESPTDLGLMSDQSQLVGRYAKRNSPAWAKAAGPRRFIYENSLMLAMAFCFFGSWLCQSVNGWRAYNHQQLEHKESTITLGGVLGERRLLGPQPPELAVRVPGDRLDGCLHGLPPPARLAGVEAGGRTARRNRNFELAAVLTQLH
jgi:hypothetical protein